MLSVEKVRKPPYNHKIYFPNVGFLPEIFGRNSEKALNDV